jgi:hypothetical protein
VTAIADQSDMPLWDVVAWVAAGLGAFLILVAAVLIDEHSRKVRVRRLEAARLARLAAHRQHLSDCSRCTFPGTVLRRERDTRHLVLVCVGHDHEGQVRGWWAPADFPFDQEAAAVVADAERITKAALA